MKRRDFMFGVVLMPAVITLAPAALRTAPPVELPPIIIPPVRNIAPPDMVVSGRFPGKWG